MAAIFNPEPLSAQSPYVLLILWSYQLCMQARGKHTGAMVRLRVSMLRLQLPRSLSLTSMMHCQPAPERRKGKARVIAPDAECHIGQRHTAVSYTRTTRMELIRQMCKQSWHTCRQSGAIGILHCLT